MTKYYKLINDKQVIFKGNVLYSNKGIILNPTEEQMLEAGWLIYNESEPTEEELLDQAKQSKIQEIDEYDKSSEVNSFTIGDVKMWLPYDLRQQLKTSVEAYESIGESQITKIFNGVEYTFSPLQWLQMLALLEVYASNALNVTERHKLNVANLLTLDEVKNYDYTVGYPSKCQF